jgi:hypothetical protein
MTDPWRPRFPSHASPADATPGLGTPLRVRSGARAGESAQGLRPPVDDIVDVPQPCPLCGSGAPPKVWAHSRCANCDSPLALPLDPEAHGQDRQGRRGALRCERDHLARLHLGWPSESVPVRWRDLSLTGLSVIAEGPVPVGRRIRVIDAGFDGVAEVIRCERQGKLHTVHARLLTAMFVQASGVFVRVRA